MTDRPTHDGSAGHMTDDQIAERLAVRILSRRGFLRVGATTGVAAASLALPIAAVHGAALDRDSVHADQQDRVLADMEAGIPTTFDGSSIQAATTELAGGGTEALQRMAPGAPGIGASAFFQLLRSHVLAGFFADPVHGGNREMIGWKLNGFPGAQMSYSDWISRYGVPFDGPYKSLAEHQAQFAQGA